MATVRLARGRNANVLVVAATKGGTGKTTIATALAARASLEASVALLDLDPQGSMSRWWELRGQPDNPALGAATGGVAAAVERLRREGFEWIILDTPPALLHVITPAVLAADVILIPCQSSAFDIEAVEPVVELAKREQKPFAFVLNRVAARSRLTSGAVKYLEQDGPVLDEHVADREVYRVAITSGKSGAEIGRDEKAREEIDALWRAVKRLAAAHIKARVK